MPSISNRNPITWSIFFSNLVPETVRHYIVDHALTQRAIWPGYLAGLLAVTGYLAVWLFGDGTPQTPARRVLNPRFWNKSEHRYARSDHRSRPAPGLCRASGFNLWRRS
jgi:hypothetical protein